MADLCQGLPQGNCTFLAASGWADTTGHPLLCLAQSGAAPWHPHRRWQCHPAGVLQDCIQLVPAGSLAKEGADPGAQDPQLGLEQDLPSPFPCPSHPTAQQEPLASTATLPSSAAAPVLSLHLVPAGLGGTRDPTPCPGSWGQIFLMSQGCCSASTAGFLPARQQVGCVLTLTQVIHLFD